MGDSVYSQCDSKKYFSVSTISRAVMKEKGLTMTIKELKEMARKSPPFMLIYTGERYAGGQRRQTKVYRYEDFLPQTG